MHMDTMTAMEHEDADRTIQLVSGEQLAAMGDLGPCELIDGRIVRMAPTGFMHGAYEVELAQCLREYARRTGAGKVVAGEVGIYIRRLPDRIRAADVAFISNERFAQIRSSSYLDIAPDVVVEVLSPEDTWTQTTDKLRDYFSIGVRSVWVADPKSRSIFVYHALTSVREFGADETLVDEVLPGFATGVGELFVV